MAVLSGDQLAELRRQIAQSQVVVTWTKPQVNAALQAIEDWFEANRAALAVTINTATAPFVFTGAQKKRLVAYWLLQKFSREGE